jgi:rhamnosyltransferase
MFNGPRGHHGGDRPPALSLAMVSILIPVKDGGLDFARCLDAIANQRIDEEVEVVVVDSGSQDGSPELARSRGSRVLEIPASEFHHGATRNLAASLARGDKLVFTTHDAYPASQDWLTTLVGHLDHPRVAGVYGRQIAHHGARPPEQFFLEFLYGPESRVQSAGSAAELSMETTLFSNVSSAMRRELWAEFPFSEDIIMSEDQEWSQRVLLAGYRLVYEARAAVRHSHKYTISTAFRHFFDLGVSGDRTWLAGARASRRVLRRNAIRYARGELAWLWRSGKAHWVPYAVVYETAKWLGLTLGSHHDRLPQSVGRRLSLMPVYWEQRERRTDETSRSAPGDAVR